MTSRLVATIQSLAERGRKLLLPAAPLLARLVYGFDFVLSGKGKWGRIGEIADWFASLHIPFATVQAPFVATVELVGGLLLMLGLGTRVCALLLSGTMVVAILTNDFARFVDALLLRGDDTLTKVTPVPFLLILIWLMAHGGGKLSVDAVLARRRAARSGVASA